MKTSPKEFQIRSVAHKIPASRDYSRCAKRIALDFVKLRIRPFLGLRNEMKRLSEVLIPVISLNAAIAGQ
jgi:hypothetical protein